MHLSALRPHTALILPFPRCNPLFMRCLKPNHKKVNDNGAPSRVAFLPRLWYFERVALPLWSSTCPAHHGFRSLLAVRWVQGWTSVQAHLGTFCRSQASLSPMWSWHSCVIQGYWRLFGSARRASRCGCLSSSSLTGTCIGGFWPPQTPTQPFSQGPNPSRTGFTVHTGPLYAAGGRQT